MKFTKVYFLSFLMVLLSLNVMSQSVDKANKLYDKGHYRKAIDVYRTLLKKNKSSYEIYHHLAESYFQINDNNNAEEWYSKVVKKDQAKADDYLKYGQILKSNGYCEKAVKWFNKYKNENPDDERVKNLISSCRNKEQFHKADDYLRVSLVPFNSEYHDVRPAKFKDGLVFSSTRPHDESKSKKSHRHKGNHFSLYYVSLNDENEYGEISHMHSSITSEYHDGPACFNNDYSKIYFTRNEYSRESKKKGQHPLHIFSADVSDDMKCTNIKSLSFNSLDYNTTHPALSPDGKKLYFSSDKSGGEGEADIWVSKKENGSWGKPQNLGDDINTSGREMYPYLDSEGNLYFASNGHGGLGGLDIFVAKKSGNGFGEIKNMGSPINSKNDDFGIMKEHPTLSGYFTSNRAGGNGKDDIYQYLSKDDITVGKYHLTGNVSLKKDNGNDGGPVNNAKVSLINKKNNKVIQNKTTGKNGTFDFELEPGNEYMVKVEKDKHFTSKKPFSTEDLILPDNLDEKNITRNIDKINVGMSLNMKQMELRKEYSLPNIYYDYDKHTIRDDAEPALDSLVGIMKDNPDIEIQLGAHTDSRGEKDYNKKLSQKRAESVIDYLIKKGIDSSRVTAKGYGENDPIVENAETDKEHQKNRRTEFKVTSYGDARDDKAEVKPEKGKDNSKN